jgi:hypothetical protein
LSAGAGAFHAEAIHVNRATRVTQLEHVAAGRQIVERNLIFIFFLRLAQFAGSSFVIDGLPERPVEVDVRSATFRAPKVVIRNLTRLAAGHIKYKRGPMRPVIAGA